MDNAETVAPATSRGLASEHIVDASPDADDPSQRRLTWSASIAHTLRTVGLVIAICLMLGAATSFLQTFLPPAINGIISNSPTAWTTITFVSILAVRAPRGLSILLGPVAFTALNLGYAAATNIRFPSGAYTYGIDVVWTIIGIIIGPLVGLLAYWMRSSVPFKRSLAISAPAVVLAADGFHQAFALSPSTPGFSIGGGLTLVAIALAYAILVGLLRLRPRWWALLTVAAVLVGAASEFLLLEFLSSGQVL